jgi:hypothetical protein
VSQFVRDEVEAALGSAFLIVFMSGKRSFLRCESDARLSRSLSFLENYILYVFSFHRSIGVLLTGGPSRQRFNTNFAPNFVTAIREAI